MYYPGRRREAYLCAEVSLFSSERPGRPLPRGISFLFREAREASAQRYLFSSPKEAREASAQRYLFLSLKEAREASAQSIMTLFVTFVTFDSS